MSIFEVPDRDLPRPLEIARRFTRHNLVNGFLAFLFAATGPLVILLKAARDGGMPGPEVSSWIFGGYAIGGFITLTFSFVFRQPISIMWTIPGAVLIGASLGHLSFAEVIGAYFACGVLVLLLGVTGSIRRIMALVPLPIVMGMVAGVFLPFAQAVIGSFVDAPVMAAAMVLAYLIAARVTAIGRIVPPILGALAAGAAVLFFAGVPGLTETPPFRLVQPILHVPEFTARALIELTIPLAVTVIGIQNAQGFAILHQAGYPQKQNTLTSVCGVGTLVFGIFGSVPACVTGPANAILNTSGPHEDRYISAIVMGVCAIAFGICAPFMVALGLALPTAYIAMLGGLAMFAVLQNAFISSFRGNFSLGALTAFVVTVSGVPIFNVGAPFWALVFGVLVSMVLERDDFQTLRQAAANK
jgi:benzoate membrane transport protein